LRINHSEDLGNLQMPLKPVEEDCEEGSEAGDEDAVL
jgi:hypothetical protein